MATTISKCNSCGYSGCHNFCVAIGCKIHLVRKQVSKDYISFVFVIELTAATPNEEFDDIMNRIFRYLDSRPEQYSLFAGPAYAKVAGRVENSCVYQKDV